MLALTRPDTLRPVPDTLAAVDDHVFASDLVAIGAFRCGPSHPLFADSGPIRNHCVVFPRTGVVIAPSGFREFVGDRATVCTYNAGQEYARRQLSPRGDLCDYFCVSENVLRDVVSSYEPGATDRLKIFDVSHVALRPAWYLQQRRIFQAASNARHASATLALEEAAVALVADVASAIPAATAHRGNVELPTARRHRDAAHAARELIARHATRPLSLGDVARTIGVSPFHLCRTFRTVTGVTMHRYREWLRLTLALEWIDDGMDLSQVALGAGYSSHSHFTAAFRRTFGTTPSRVRTTASPGRALSEGPRIGPESKPKGGLFGFVMNSPG